MQAKGLAIVALLLALVAGCESTEVARSDELMQPQRLMEYIIGPADVLSISILNQPAMDRTVTVRPDGMISFPLIAEVSASGMTPAQLEDAMTTALAEYIQLIPGELTVVVDEVHSYTVSVLGEVRSPGRFEFQHSATVLDALAEAGGLTEFASSKQILILRTEPQGIRRIVFNYDKLLDDPQGNMEMTIYPGDTVLVP